MTFEPESIDAAILVEVRQHYAALEREIDALALTTDQRLRLSFGGVLSLRKLLFGSVAAPPSPRLGPAAGRLQWCEVKT